MTHLDIIAPEHPGTFIQEELEARGWAKGDLAYILGIAPESLSRILNGQVGISAKMAVALGDAFDIPAEFFANLQKLYYLGQAERHDPGAKARASLSFSPYSVCMRDVRPLIESALAELEGVNAIVYEPTSKYQNVAKRTGVEKLTPARALVAEMVRRYSLLGIECSILEVQKLGWFLERGVKRFGGSDALKFSFQANKYGPYSHNLTKLLDSLDGSYLRCDKRLADADPLDLIWFNDAKYDRVQAYLNSGEGKQFSSVLEWASATIDGFESPLGMELLATVDWMMQHDDIEATVEGVMEGIKDWAGGETAGQRKLKIFDRRLVAIALEQLQTSNRLPA